MHTPESLEPLSGIEIDKLVAEVQDFTKVPSGNDIETDLWKEDVSFNGEWVKTVTQRYHPTQNTESGRSQAWELMVKYKMVVTIDLADGTNLAVANDSAIKNKNPQRAVCEAVILAKTSIAHRPAVV